MDQYLLVIIAGICGGLGALYCNIPGGAVVGAMLASGLVVMFLPTALTLPAPAATTIQILLGISLGLTFNRSFLTLGAQAIPIAVLSTLCLLIVAVGMAFLASKLGLLDFGTGLFGFSPGGMTGMAILAQTEGHQGAIVAFLHMVRIFTLFITVPLLVRIVMYLQQK